MCVCVDISICIYICVCVDTSICIYILHTAQEWKIALWPNTRVVKCKFMCHRRQTSTTIRATGTIFQTLFILQFSVSL